MLGSMLVQCAQTRGLRATYVSRGDFGFDAGSTSCAWSSSLPMPSLIINCVALTRIGIGENNGPEAAMRINGWFPHRLQDVADKLNARLIHTSTDGVFVGRQAAYAEHESPDANDVYGISKALGEVQSPNSLNVRTSIVGPEIEPRGHLLDWFLNHPDGSSVRGFTNHIWHGVTTLQLANFFIDLSDERYFSSIRQLSSVIHFAPNAPISKFDLLNEINEAFGRKIEVERVESTEPRRRLLQSMLLESSSSMLKPGNIRDALLELSSFVSKSKRRSAF